VTFCPQCGLSTKGKNPWAAAILNLVIPGLGYLFAGSKRRFFRIGVTAGTIVSLLSPSLWTEDFDAMFWIGGAIIAVIFAVDAYQDAKQTKPLVSGEPT
jgi:hypothetical protein